LVCRAEARDCGGEPGAWDIAHHGGTPHGISSGLLYTWRRHLLEGSLGVTRQPVAEFARVEVMAVPADPAPAISPVAPAIPSGPMNHPDGMIEITLPGGVSVRVDARVDSDALRRVLAALARR
jgi:transposase